MIAPLFFERILGKKIGRRDTSAPLQNQVGAHVLGDICIQGRDDPAPC